MDKLRIFYELLCKYAEGEDFISELQDLVNRKIVNQTNNINLRTILDIVDIAEFNMIIFNINKEEYFNSTDEVRNFVSQYGIDKNMEFADFLTKYRNLGYFIKFRVKKEPTYNNKPFGNMTEFTYAGKV